MTRNLRVLHILETPQFAGTEAHVLTLMQSLDPATVQGALLCRQDSPLHQRALALGFPCHTPATFAQFVRLVRQEAFSVLHAHDGAAKAKAVLAASRAGIVATQHFVQPAYTHRVGWKGALSKAVHRCLNASVSMTIAVSDAVRDAALERAEMPPARITVIPNGILPPVLAAPADVYARLQALGIPLNAPLVCTVSRLSPEKGLVYLLQAIPQVLEVLPEARFLLLGDGAERQALQAEAVRLQVQEAVIFAGFRNDVSDLVSQCRLFVLPSFVEAFGLSLVEAMALARPVVAMRAGGPLEIVLDGETGLLVAPADSSALAEAMLTLLTDPARAARMGEAGLRRMQTRFTADTMARRTEAVYAQCARP